MKTIKSWTRDSDGKIIAVVMAGCGHEITVVGGNPEKQGKTVQFALDFIERSAPGRECPECSAISAMAYEERMDNALAGNTPQAYRELEIVEKSLIPGQYDRKL